MQAQNEKAENKTQEVTTPKSFIYAGVGLNSGTPVVVGFDKYTKGKIVKFLTTGGYFVYDKYNYTSVSQVSTYTIGARQSVQLIPLINSFMDNPINIPVNVYVGFQEAYRLSVFTYNDPDLKSLNSVSGHFLFQPVAGAEYYFLKDKLGAYVELGRTTGASISAGLKLKFTKQEKGN
jgi:hypothetical protein